MPMPETNFDGLKKMIVEAYRTYATILTLIYLKSLKDQEENLKAYMELVRLKIIPVKLPALI